MSCQLIAHTHTVRKLNSSICIVYLKSTRRKESIFSCHDTWEMENVLETFQQIFYYSAENGCVGNKLVVVSVFFYCGVHRTVVFVIFD